MNILSLFDGISCCRVALDRAGIKIEKYYASETNEYAVKVAQANYPETVQLGDATNWRDWDLDWSNIDLLTAGFPCQAWSVAGKQKGDKDPRGALVHTLIDIRNHCMAHNPNLKFLFENVRMKKEFLDYINGLFGVEPILINSSLVSAQRRVRCYWTNIDNVTQPEDKGIMLADIVEHGFVNSAAIVGRKLDENGKRNDKLDSKPIQCLEVHEHGKSRCLSTVAKDTVISNLPKGRYLIGMGYNRKDGLGKELTKAYSLNASDWRGLNRNQNQTAVVMKQRLRGNNKGFEEVKLYRSLTPIECERLQTLPDNYTNHVSKTQRIQMLGNAWTVDVIAHIFKGLK